MVHDEPPADSTMKLFACQNCGQPLYFENTRCESCGLRLGYVPEREAMTALEPSNGDWRSVGVADNPHRFCINAEHNVCNWLVAADGVDTFCTACRHNRTIPDLTSPE